MTSESFLKDIKDTLDRIYESRNDLPKPVIVPPIVYEWLKKEGRIIK